MRQISFEKLNAIMKKILSLAILILLAISCTVLSDPRVVISKKSDGRDGSDKYFWKVELKNEGEKPAYFVILILTAWKSGKEIERKEYAYGDIFPNQFAEETIILNKVGFETPDSTTFKITYTATDLSNPLR